MNLETIMLSESSQRQRAPYCMIPFILNIKNRQIHRDRMQISGCQGRRREGWGLSLFNGYRVSFGTMKKILELENDDGCTTL